MDRAQNTRKIASTAIAALATLSFAAAPTANWMSSAGRVAICTLEGIQYVSVRGQGDVPSPRDEPNSACHSACIYDRSRQAPEKTRRRA